MPADHPRTLVSPINPRGLLIPSVKMTELDGLKVFGKYFSEVELDLYGMSRDIGENERNRMGKARSLIDDEGLKIYSVHMRDINLSKDSLTTPDAAVAYCNIVHSILHPRIAVLHPGKGDMDTLLRNLGYVLKRIPPDMSIVIENMTSWQAVLNSPQSVREFVERGFSTLPPNHGVVIDATHPSFDPDSAHVSRYTPLVLEYMDAASSGLKHLHLSDRSWADGRSRKHLPIGGGVVDWAAIDKHLREKEYDGRAAIEIRFSDGIADKIISSFLHYSACVEKSLNSGEGVIIMPGQGKITKLDFIKRLGSLPSLDKAPPSLIRLLNAPKEGVLEETDDFKYFVVPSESYGKNHADPYDVLVGDSEDTLKWASYIFGVRYHGTSLSAILVDKERNISVATTILSAYGEWKENWPIFEKAINRAIESAANPDMRARIILDHVNLTSQGDIEYIEAGDRRAWKPSL